MDTLTCNRHQCSARHRWQQDLRHPTRTDRVRAGGWRHSTKHFAWINIKMPMPVRPGSPGCARRRGGLASCPALWQVRSRLFRSGLQEGRQRSSMSCAARARLGLPDQPGHVAGKDQECQHDQTRPLGNGCTADARQILQRPPQILLVKVPASLRTVTCRCHFHDKGCQLPHALKYSRLQVNQTSAEHDRYMISAHPRQIQYAISIWTDKHTSLFIQGIIIILKINFLLQQIAIIFFYHILKNRSLLDLRATLKERLGKQEHIEQLYSMTNGCD